MSEQGSETNPSATTDGQTANVTTPTPTGDVAAASPTPVATPAPGDTVPVSAGATDPASAVANPTPTNPDDPAPATSGDAPAPAPVVEDVPPPTSSNVVSDPGDDSWNDLEARVSRLESAVFTGDVPAAPSTASDDTSSRLDKLEAFVHNLTSAVEGAPAGEPTGTPADFGGDVNAFNTRPATVSVDERGRENTEAEFRSVTAHNDAPPEETTA